MDQRRTQPRVLYISYDGASEPLGRSQVVAYLERLAADCTITLLSFEKPTDDRTEMTQRLASVGISWTPLTYHKRPPVLSTLWDMLRGAAACRKLVRRERAQIVHVRSYVPAVIALLAAPHRTWKLLFDIRGFWVDERVEGGIWPAGGLLYRIGKRCERWLFGSADAVVTLTQASVPQIETWTRGRNVPIHVIPTCVATDRYPATRHRDSNPRLIWCGSMGTWYRFELAVELAEIMELPLVVLTRQVELARKLLRGRPADIRTVAHEQVAAELCRGGIGLCLITTGAANLARAPTRFAEYLAAGMAVAVTPGVGDLDELVAAHQLGAVVEGDDETSLRKAATRLLEAWADPDLAERAQLLATDMFGLTTGVSRYREIYRQLLDSDPSGGPAATVTRRPTDTSR